MSGHRALMVFLGIMALYGAGHGYPKRHGPFHEWETPTPVPLTDCAVVKREYQVGDDTGYPSILHFTARLNRKGATLRMERLVGANSCCWRITVLDGKGEPISKPVTNDMPSYVYDVKSADLNQDGRVDFLVNIWSGGCGLAAAGSTTTFLLSVGDRYVATNFHGFEFGREDIVSFKKGGPSYFIHNDLIGNGDEKTKDGRDHNFWVYQLYRFTGSGMVEANGDDPRFPKWVWYTFKENHGETDQLTMHQKRRLLNPRSSQQDDTANGSQPIRSETNQTSSAAVSRH